MKNLLLEKLGIKMSTDFGKVKMFVCTSRYKYILNILQAAPYSLPDKAIILARMKGRHELLIIEYNVKVDF